MDKSKELKGDPLLLMQEAQKGDTTAFSLLYDMYYLPIFRYLYYRLKNKEDAEDIAQTVFIKIYSNIERFKNTGKSPLAYFFTVARNTLIDHIRKRKETPTEYTENVSTNANPNHLERVMQKEEKSVIQSAIKQLTDEQQEVIVLKFINELSNREIASLLNKTEEAVRQLQCRALKHLKKILYEHNQ